MPLGLTVKNACMSLGRRNRSLGYLLAQLPLGLVWIFGVSSKFTALTSLLPRMYAICGKESDELLGDEMIRLWRSLGYRIGCLTPMVKSVSKTGV
jgi:hypothetical protein